ncbi:MAG: transcription termination/antitermination NusG family protein [Armatimonadota bacterium]|nr:transcription termination/antitermination NusG family protein [Armatimonadota bacterium]MDR7464858.1 transcription termination/antitermination NusG family protein [Armatimonadota bacterium]MDR7471007.1 transcription termination/antitermination NusG family protein [Armatimonadota bacterium]
MSADGAFWYAIQSKVRAEQRVFDYLLSKDIDAFLPCLLARHRHGSRRWEAPEPLFPGYLFARFQPAPHLLHQVRWAPGVRRLLGDDDGPIPVPDDVIGYLRERQGERGYIVPRQPFVPGARVRFRRGPFALLEGVIDRPASRADRVRVLLLLVHTPVAVEVHIDELALA